MQNSKVLHSLTHGMYVLTTKGAGCFVDAVCQVSGGDNPLISVCVMKKNHTNEVLHQNNTFAISIFGLNDDPELIKTYGFNSSRDFDKFAHSSVTEVLDTPVVDSTLGYIVCEKVDMIENETHTIFIGRVIEGVKNFEDKPMSYNYYQEHKEDIMKVKSEKGKTYYICVICGYVYEGETLPEDYVCPICGVDATMFEKKTA